MSKNSGAGDERKPESENDSKGIAIIAAIFRSIEQADALLELLSQKHDEREDQQEEAGAVRYSFSECKQVLDDAVTIEEIKAVNCQLRYLVTELMKVLECKDRKVSALQERLVQLEEEYDRLKGDENTQETSTSTSSEVTQSKEDEE